MISYDRESNITLPVVRAYPQDTLPIQLLKNRGSGALGAVLTGFEDSTAPAVLMYPADDDYNTPRIDLLVKSHRLGWQICEVPAAWLARRVGKSRFQVLNWVPQYFKWFLYAFATTCFFRGPQTVRMKQAPCPTSSQSA